MPIFNPILVGKQLPTLTTPGAASDLASGKQLIGQDGEIVTGNVPVVTELSMTGTPSVSGSNLVIGRPSTMRAILPYQVPVKMDAPLTSLGDATAADVVSGKTFTSTAGLKVTGTAQKAPAFVTYTCNPSTVFQTSEPSSWDTLYLRFYVPRSVTNVENRIFKVFIGDIAADSTLSNTWETMTRGNFEEIGKAIQYGEMRNGTAWERSAVAYYRCDDSEPIITNISTSSVYGRNVHEIRVTIQAKFWSTSPNVISGIYVPFRLEVY